MEIFKKSLKSICHNCFNLDEECSLETKKTCGTDQKVAAAYVQKCSHFNKKLGSEENHSDNSVSVQHSVDSRVEMMGGGH